MNRKEGENISEKEKNIIKNLADKLPHMTEHERGYLEGTINTAAAMSKKTEAQSSAEKTE